MSPSCRLRYVDNAERGGDRLGEEKWQQLAINQHLMQDLTIRFVLADFYLSSEAEDDLGQYPQSSRPGVRKITARFINSRFVVRSLTKFPRILT